MKTIQMHIPRWNILFEELPEFCQTQANKELFQKVYLEALDVAIQQAQRVDVSKPIISFYTMVQRGPTYFWGVVVRDENKPWSSQSNWYLENTSQDVWGGGILYDPRGDSGRASRISVVGY